MNPAAILNLISDLYTQIETLVRANEEKDQRIAELEAEQKPTKASEDH